ncbi:hypothetical protein BAUCODRAFT_33706 [Baudoinia panamericana UAMH 10762]|uniref:C2H2-type domain-containing protein n=1 Tax=Baudoinia panamericana (strain UAMH 10762) TaxID=717646 RepID=M2NB52_BAUPA|nr:uncharacterized protein BAUCODRAFT_33706 [Baudoinia panamericana UAMH 10762]EMC96379.1 hypothetical protein BAUCODRAFT_33706 [Baudoinia panamericana UAMH 10762]
MTMLYGECLENYTMSTDPYDDPTEQYAMDFELFSPPPSMPSSAGELVVPPINDFDTINRTRSAIISVATSCSPMRDIDRAAGAWTASLAYCKRPLTPLSTVNLETSSTRAQCHVCGKGFGANKSLRRHMRSQHEGLRYRCSGCGKAFGRRDIRNRHAKEKHGPNGNLLECDHCGQMVSRRALERHRTNRCCLPEDATFATQRRLSDCNVSLQPRRGWPSMLAVLDPLVLIFRLSDLCSVRLSVQGRHDDSDTAMDRRQQVMPSCAQAEFLRLLGVVYSTLRKAMLEQMMSDLGSASLMLALWLLAVVEERANNRDAAFIHLRALAVLWYRNAQVTQNLDGTMRGILSSMGESYSSRVVWEAFAMSEGFGIARYSIGESCLMDVNRT